ncbi:hypothetical protein FRX31_018422 [Thalictrum thalictroides]|uniref:Uncharacterized protein n=1 Tax=Thalictrum thalictroides TaxID=46969 RepID=A0A7J6W632_THATH|nr:hypothetical protein FRX31_018422 [Thalictrum thalictroides]
MNNKKRYVAPSTSRVSGEMVKANWIKSLRRNRRRTEHLREQRDERIVKYHYGYEKGKYVMMTMGMRRVSTNDDPTMCLLTISMRRVSTNDDPIHTLSEEVIPTLSEDERKDVEFERALEEDEELKNEVQQVEDDYDE